MDLLLASIVPPTAVFTVSRNELAAAFAAVSHSKVGVTVAGVLLSFASTGCTVTGAGCSRGANVSPALQSLFAVVAYQ